MDCLLKYAKTIIADGLIKESSSTLDEIDSKTLHTDEESDR